jgi:serine/threonine-protein kinase HipA
MIKFDGVGDPDRPDPESQPYNRIEYAYSLMARETGIEMAETRLLEERGLAHFMTRRFDRPADGGRIHQQSLCAIAHFDFNDPGSYSYEQAFQVIRRLRLPYEDTAQQYRRMVFNVIARNQDDHTKNIAFLMDREGNWRLSPAFDVIYAYNPSGEWTSRHQMSVNGRREDITRDDLLAVATEMGVKQATAIVNEVGDAVSRWPRFAADAGVEPSKFDSIGQSHCRL